MTVELTIQTALLDRAEGLLDIIGLPMSWPNKAFDPPVDGSSYLEVIILPNRNTRIFYGSNEDSWRMGILQINLVSEYNKGPSSGTEIAGQIALHFPQDFVIFSGGVKVQLTKTPDVGSAVANTARTSWIVPVSVYYEAFA